MINTTQLIDDAEREANGRHQRLATKSLWHEWLSDFLEITHAQTMAALCSPWGRILP